MKKLLFMAALAAMVSSLYAQQDVTMTETEVIVLQDKYRVITNRFFDNWFISVGGGAQILYGHDNDDGKFSKRISPAFNVALGKWFTPGLGLRLQYSGLSVNGFSRNGDEPYIKSGPEDGLYKKKINYMNLHGDAMFNLNALFGGYNERRVYEVIPYVGAGVTHSYSKPHTQALTVNCGILNRFRLCDFLDLNLELSATGLEGKFDGNNGGKHNYDCIFGATLGLTYKFGKKRGFSRPYPQLISALELAALNNTVNDMAAANAALQEQVQQLESQPVEVVEADVVIETSIAPRTVFFDINSYTLSPRELMNLKYLAETMQQEPDATYTVYGYADSSTGTPKFNSELSLKRAQAVVDALVNEYGISADRLTTDAGGGVDTFGKPVYLNRVVLVKSSN
jgi:outer membrane protein OmpA-like peptidoglycan-associated protein/opacity protein-like surface antigen